MESTTIETKAGRFCESFGKALGSGTTQGATPAMVAQAMFDHWHPQKFIAFSPMGGLEFAGKETSVPKLTEILDQFVKNRLGLDLRLDGYRTELISPSRVFCFLAVSVHPPVESGMDVIKWETVYAFRVSQGQENGYFDFAVLDNELAALLENCPTFLEGIDLMDPTVMRQTVDG